MIGQMSLYLIRHGETALNVARVFQPADTPLNERGVAQAEALARRLQAMDVTAILSSDLPRARRTAEAIAAVTGLPIEFTALLHERNFGDWRGRPHDGIAADPMTIAEAPPNGESIAVFERRVAQAFEQVVQRRAALSRGNLAVVSHGLVLRVMLDAHVLRPAGVEAPAHMGNTSLSIVEAHAPHRATLMNNTEHLEPGVRDNANALSGG
jgi:broad specificity phosphatase PhoE